MRDLPRALLAMREDMRRLGTRGAAEPVPVPGSGAAPDRDLAELHGFAESSPMYGAPRVAELGSVRCSVYGLDTDRYWLSSTGHAGSRAPFSPTWLMSAYALASAARGMGCTDAVDVGAGDGRIALCAGMLGMASHAVEIDGGLAALHARAGGRFETHLCDAASLDYGALGLGRPAFFIGGLAQMGAAGLASGIMGAVRGIPGLWEGSAWVLPGTRAPKYAPDPAGHAGWGTVMAENRLEAALELELPTAWTAGEPGATPYVLARPGSQ